MCMCVSLVCDFVRVLITCPLCCFLFSVSSSRRRGSGSSARKDKDATATESELDEELIDRPKLSYKKKSSARAGAGGYASNNSYASNSGSRPASDTFDIDANQPTLSALYNSSQSHIGSAIHNSSHSSLNARSVTIGGGAGDYSGDGAGAGAGGSSDMEESQVEETDEELYERPKLTYGSGLRSNSSYIPPATSFG